MKCIDKNEYKYQIIEFDIMIYDMINLLPDLTKIILSYYNPYINEIVNEYKSKMYCDNAVNYTYYNPNIHDFCTHTNNNVLIWIANDIGSYKMYNFRHIYGYNHICNKNDRKIYDLPKNYW